jgi:hypothetical protein
MDKVKIADAEFVLNMPPVETGGCSILAVGSTRSGKSFALKHILDKYFKKHLGAIFSQSARADAYKNMNYPLLPLAACYIPELIHDAYKINMETDNYYPFLFVIDDCPTIRADKELMKMATIYRNSGVSSITCVQSLQMLSPVVRSNINFVLLFKQNNTESIERTIKCFLRGYLPGSWNYEKKIDWYRRNTENHFFIFIDNLAGTIQRCKIGD